MQHIRNIAIIAHVDHGKTTLVDCLLKQSGTFRANQHESQEERLMDSMDLEKEKGITIRAKNAAFQYKEYHINIVDTPGHADFGGEVERIMNMIDGVLLVVDAADGPQAQTRFVLRKALEAGAKPIVVINKIDRENANPKKVLDEVFELFISLNATDEQLDFPSVYCSRQGTATPSVNSRTPATDGAAVRRHRDTSRRRAPRRATVSRCSWPTSITAITSAVSRSANSAGKVKVGERGLPSARPRQDHQGKITPSYHFEGLKRIEVPEAHAGDIVGITGFRGRVHRRNHCRQPKSASALPYIPIDPPTIQMEFAVNDGPLAGQDGKLVTARHIWERLQKEIRTNVALRIAQTADPKIFDVEGPRRNADRHPRRADAPRRLRGARLPAGGHLRTRRGRQPARAHRETLPRNPEREHRGHAGEPRQPQR